MDRLGALDPKVTPWLPVPALIRLSGPLNCFLSARTFPLSALLSDTRRNVNPAATNTQAALMIRPGPPTTPI